MINVEVAFATNEKQVIIHISVPINNTIIDDNIYIEDLEYILQKIRHICCLKINICNIIYK